MKVKILQILMFLAFASLWIPKASACDLKTDFPASGLPKYISPGTCWDTGESYDDTTAHWWKSRVLAVYFKGAVQWCPADCTPNSNNTLRLQSDGNMVIYNTYNQALWASGTNGENFGGNYFTVGNSCAEIINNVEGTLWTSNEQNPACGD